MSVEFDICKCALDEDGWEEVLDSWARELPDEELFREPVFQEGTAFLLGRGSIRGASLTIVPEESQVVRLRLNALASRADWRRGFQVVRRALGAGGGEVVREDGTTFSAAQLTDAEAEAQAARDFCSTLGVVHDGLSQGEVTFPLDAFGLVVRPGELPASCTPAEVPGLEAPLAERVERLALAFPSSTFVLQGGLKLATWARIPTLVGEADLVSIEGLENPVPLDELKRVLGSRAEAAGEGVTLLPELDEKADSALLAVLRAASVDLSAFARARGIEVPEGGFGPTPGGEPPDLDEAELPGLYLPLAGAIARVVAAASQGQDPRLVRRGLIREGLDEQTADLALHVVGRVLGQLFDARGEPTERTPEDLIEALIQDGLPPMVAEVSVATIAQLLGGEEPDEPDEPEEPRSPGGLILPPGMR